MERSTFRTAIATLTLALAAAALLTACAASAADLETNLRSHVERLTAAGPGARHTVQKDAYFAAADSIRRELESMGYQINEYPVPGDFPPNIEAVRRGSIMPGQSIVVGAHYDTEPDTPGADDNASGVAGVIELARLFRNANTERTVRFVLFPNEETPYFGTPLMGSLNYARALRARGEDVHAMISVEMIGYFDDAPGSQSYPPGTEDMLGIDLPNRADFIAVVSRTADATLVRRAADAFADATDIPVFPAALPAWVRGVGSSDHWAFWQHDMPAIMITDTSYYRNPHYHQPSDTADTLDYPRMARTVRGIAGVIDELAGRIPN